MSYAAPFSLLSFHLPDRDDSAEGRLTWPLAGSLTIHVVLFIAFLSLRFASSLEQSSGSYEVTLVTLPELSASPTASPAKQSKPERSTDQVPPPKAAPQRKAATPPGPVPREKPRVPERVTDSLVGALDSVVLPEPQALALHQKAAPLPPPPLPPLPVLADPKPEPKRHAGSIPLPREDDAVAPEPERVTESLVSPLDSVVVPKLQASPALPQEAEPVQAPVLPAKQAPAVKMDVQPIQTPPQPPKLLIEKPDTPAPSPRAELLAQRLKQAVGTIVVPKKPEPTSRRANLTVSSEGKPKQEPTKTTRSSDITLPAQAPRLAVVSPPKAPKKQMPPQTARKNSTVESLTQAIQAVRIPERITKTPQPVSGAVPLVRESSPKHPEAAEAPNMPPTIVPPQAPQLAQVPVDQTLVASEAAVPRTSTESDALERQIAKLAIPRLPDSGVQPGFQQSEGGLRETLELRVTGSSPKENAYWGRVRAMIASRWIVYRVEFKRSQPLQVVLAFRVERNGRVTEPAVARSSGNKYFDLAAKRAVVAAVPLPPFPANMPNPYYDVQYTFTGPRNR